MQKMVTSDELAEMYCDTTQELEVQIRNQIDNGVASDDGEVGVDWMAAYELEVALVNG